MKQKDLMTIAIIVIIATVFSTILANKLFNSSKHHNLKAAKVEPISSSFPDVKNDPTYKTFFNNEAIDPTQLIKIGTSKNDSPFTSDQ
jgi:hypothetical protein